MLKRYQEDWSFSQWPTTVVRVTHVQCASWAYVWIYNISIETGRVIDQTHISATWILEGWVQHFREQCSEPRILDNPPDVYEFTLYTFYCSNMLLSIAYFAWGRVIIYDDNVSYRGLSAVKRKIYILISSLLKEMPLSSVLRDLRRVFWLKNLPRTIFSAFAWCFLGTKNHS